MSADNAAAQSGADQDKMADEWAAAMAEAKAAEPGTALAKATEYLQELAKTAAPMSLMVMKQQVYRHLNTELGDSWKESIKWMDESLKRSDFREGVRSFIEKRPPKFTRITAAQKGK